MSATKTLSRAQLLAREPIPDHVGDDPAFVPCTGRAAVVRWATAAAAGGAEWPTVFLAELVCGADESTAKASAYVHCLSVDAGNPDGPECQRPIRAGLWETCRGGWVSLEDGGVRVGRYDPDNLGALPAYRLAFRPPTLPDARALLARKERDNMRIERRIARQRLLAELVSAADSWVMGTGPVPASVRRHCVARGDWRIGVGIARSPRRGVFPYQTIPELAAELWMRTRQYRAIDRARYADGTLRGVRRMAASDDGVLRSPDRGTTWTGPVLRAEGFDPEAPLRGEAGIHACWPCARPGFLPRDNDASSGNCIAEVSGWGMTVHGDMGWRAEVVMIQSVWVPWWLVAAVQKRYPEVVVELLGEKRSEEDV